MQRKETRSFQTRILRRVTLIEVICFAAFAILGVYLVQREEREHLGDIHTTLLSEVSYQLETPIRSILQDVQTMATDPHARQFAVDVSGRPRRGTIDSQQAMLQDFTTLMLQDPSRYMRIRYLNRSGAAWGSVAVVNNVVQPSDDKLELDAVSKDDQAVYDAILKAQVGEIAVGAFTLRRDAAGVPLDPPVPIFTLFAPVADIGDSTNILGAVEFEVFASPLLDTARQTMARHTEEGERLLMLSSRNQIILDTAATGSAYLQRLASLADAPVDDLLYQAINSFVAQNPQEVLTAYGDNRIISVHLLNIGSADQNPWRMVLTSDVGAVFGDANLLSAGIALAMAALTVLVVFATRALLRPVLTPVATANALVQKIAAGQATSAAAAPQTGDEAGEMIQALGSISQRLDGLNSDLKSQVARRTRDLEIAARIGRETATLHDSDELVKRAIELICRDFGFYHAQVFLIDDVGVNAVLTHSHGEAGKKLLEQGHRIAVGSNSLVGAASSTGKPVIVNDVTRHEGPHIFNPLLPLTKAEMGLPLVIGDQIIGVLDIQSTEAGAFRQEELPVFELLADQLAVAINNARLITQSDKRIQQIDTLNRQLTRTAWEEAAEKIGMNVGYDYNLMETTPLASDQSVSPEGLSAPITIRGEVIGTLTAVLPDGHTFTQGDQAILRAVADRVALALENVRLFQETQISLSETSTLYQLSRYLNEANTLEDILQAIVISVMPDAVSGQIWVFDDHASTESPQWMELKADLALIERTQGNENLTGTRLFMPDYWFFANLRDNQVTLVHDIEEDTRLDPHLHDLLARLTMRSAVFVPLSLRGLWRGVITLGFGEPREYSEREGRIYSALIDQAGVAIDNRLLLQQTEQALARNENLYAASRVINTAKTLQDLVYAAVPTSTDSQLSFWLGLWEGELDSDGWPTRSHIVARTEGGVVQEDNRVYEIAIEPDSPIRRREAEVLVDADVNAPPRTERIRWMREQGLRFFAVFPMFSANQPIGAFYVTAPEPRELTAQDYEVYRALTGQMSTQIQNRRLLERTAQALDETRRLYVASRAISSAQDSEAVFHAAAEHLGKSLATTGTGQVIRITLLMASPKPSLSAPYLEYAYGWCSDETATSSYKVGDQLAASQIPLGRILEHSEGALSLKDVATDLANEPALLQHLRQDQLSSVVLAPIQSRQTWFGVLTIGSSQTNAFDDQYVRFAQAVADQVAITIENQKLFEASQQEARRAQQEAQRALALAEVGQLASRIGADFERSIGEVFRRVAEAAGYDRWMLTQLDPARTRLNVVAHEAPAAPSQSSASADPLYFDMTTGQHSLVDAVRLNEPLMINDPRSYFAFSQADPAFAEIVGKHIIVPLNSGGQVIGALLIGRAVTAEDLDERDQQLVAILAAQVVVALENRRLFEEAENERRTLGSVLATLPAGVLVLDPKTLKPVLFNDTVSELLGQPIDRDKPFNAEDYRLYRTGTQLPYPQPELPIFVALETGESAFADDVAMISQDVQVDLLVNAAPIRDARGRTTAIIAAFENISNLRSLENTLQENLRETVALYEAQRALVDAQEIEDVLDVTVVQLAMLQPFDGYVFLNDPQPRLVRELMQPPAEPEVFTALLADRSESFHIENTAAADLPDGLIQGLQRMGIGAMAAMLLQTSLRDAALGWLMLVYDTPQTINPDHERTLAGLGDIAATALENRYLFESTQTALQNTARLYNATTSLSRSRDIESISEALQGALQPLEPDQIAAYIVREGERSEGLFNIAREGDLIDLQPLLQIFGGSEQASLIEDTAQAPVNIGQISVLANTSIRALAAVPLRVKDAANGRLFVAYHRPHSFTEDEARYLNAIADSASLRLDNILLFDQIQTTLEETSILYQASRALSDASGPQGILDVVVNYLIQPHVNQVFIALLGSRTWDTPGATVQVVAAWSEDGGVNLQGISLTRDQFPAWNQLATPIVVTIDDVYADDRLDPLERIGVESLDARSVVVIPLRVPQRAIGAIWIGSREPYRHAEREARIYQALAEQASLALEAGHLLEQTERRARQLETSSRVSQTIGQILDLDVLLPQLVHLIRDTFGYDHVQVFLMDEDDNYAVLRASTGEAGRQLLAIKHKLQKKSQSVIGQVTAKGVPQIALDTADAAVVHKPNPYLPLTRSEMALPLITKGKVAGALDVQSNQPNAFGPEDVEVLTTLAAQISVAIDNARLYEDAQQRANQMSFLFDVTTAAASAETLKGALENVAQRLHDTFEPLSVAIYLPQVYVDTISEDNRYTVMQVVALAGAEQPLSEISEVRVDDPHNLIGVVSAELQPMIIGQTADEPRYVPIVTTAQSAMIVPLSSVGQVIGLINMEDSRPHAYDRDTLQVLLALSGSLSAIIQNALLLEQMQRTNEQLRELDRLKSDFLANMSHELRTPLNSIIGFSRVMLKGIDGTLTEMQEQDLTTIYNSGQHLLMLINDILDQAKIAAGKMDLKFAYFEIKPLIESVRSIGIGLVKDKPIQMLAEIAPVLPKAYGDEFRTRQVLLNLVSNASKFTQEGSVTIRAYPVQDEKSSKPMIRVDVLDTGIGIAERDMPLLFEAFRQVDSSLTRTAGGTGLGLPIAKSLIEMQGGTMMVTSKVNAGSTFSIAIPTEPMVNTEQANERDTANEVQQASPTPAKRERVKETLIVPSPQPGGPSAKLMLTKRQVLLIEDSPDLVDQFRRALQREGFEVFAATIPLEAEAMASGLRPTVIIMDVNFAGGKGWNILSRIKERDDTFDIPVVVITLSDESERAYNLGVHSYLQRPFMPEDLTKAVLEAEKESRVERILIIDDQPDSIRLLKQLLNEHGKYRVFSAGSGSEGISMVARRRPDLIILDLRMPEMDGFAVLDELRSNPETAKIPVMVVTGDVVSGDEQQQLANIHVLQKTDINQDTYERFIMGVKAHLEGTNGSN